MENLNAMIQFEKLTKKRNSSFHFRYEASLNQWEVLNETGILFIGTKENCQRYVQLSSLGE